MYAEELTANDLEAASMIALWLLIHGGDPAPDGPAEVATIAGRIIASLSNFAFGEASQTTVDAIRSRLDALQVRVQEGQSPGGDGGVTPDYLVVGHGKVRYLVWPNPDGDPIIVPIYSETNL
jgi:hypothetical protein